MDADQESSPCECPAAGFCKRFNRKMSDVQHRACQTNAGGYRDHHAAIAAGEPSPVVARATASAPTSPHLWAKALNFTRAIFHQAPLAAEAILTGDESKAFRSADEIERIAGICKACPLFNGEICTHKDCGCNIDAKRNVFLSKLAWRSQKCPDEPPKWS